MSLIELGAEAVCPMTLTDGREGKPADWEPRFPGYVFFKKPDNLEYRDLYYRIARFRKVLSQKRADGGICPDTLKDEYVTWIINLESLEQRKDYEQTDIVLVVEGPFAGYEGIVSRVDRERVTALLTILGRERPVALKRSQVQPV